jgi:anthranilate phosphoribosyltransferase
MVRTYEVTPEEFGFKRATLGEISGGSASENAKVIREVLNGRASPSRDIVLLNAAAALVAAGKADRLSEGLPMAVHSIDSGAAASKLAAMARFTNHFPA